MIAKPYARRGFLAGAGLALAGPTIAAPPPIADGTDATSAKPGMIIRNTVPLNLEAPISAFAEPITANDKFFVRYNLATPPSVADLKDWSLRIGGDAAERPFQFSMEDLRKLPTREVVALCHCAGNARSRFNPQADGIQWDEGAMGCARWRGVRLRDVLLKTGFKPEALEVVLTGADSALNPQQQAYAKSLPIEVAMDAGTLLASEMNGQVLPLVHGYPLRLIVPGWSATYWMKHVTALELRSSRFDGFWMTTAYRVPRGLFPVDRAFVSQETATTSPVTENVLNCVITNVRDGDTVPLAGLELRGVAWGGGGVQSVSVSLDDGTRWRSAILGPDIGRYAFRTWRYTITGVRPGPLSVLVRAASNDGQTQGERVRYNPGGYHYNTQRKLTLVIMA
ncbi:MAG: sulfite oxidase [Acetobacteraceae bacterium]|nr:sulfite oxidase [Acetobacteraceae bacterium]